MRRRTNTGHGFATGPAHGFSNRKVDGGTGMGKAPHAKTFVRRVSEHRWAIAIRRGFLLSLPLVMVGSFALVLGNIPLSMHFVGPAHAEWQVLCDRMGAASFGIIAVCLSMTISHSLALHTQESGQTGINPMAASIVALISFLVMAMPANGSLSAEALGSHSVFAAAFAAIASTEIFLWLLRVRWLRLQQTFNDADPLLPVLLQSILPAILTITVFVLVDHLLGWGEHPAASLLGHGVEAIFAPIESPLLRALLFNLLSQLLWFVGAHGNDMLSAIEHNVFDAATASNAAAVAAGRVPTEIFTKPFFDVFVYMGGSGTMLGLAIATLVGCPGSNQQKLARIGLLPAMFNISEILVFGLPVVFNPVFFIPFVVTPLALVVTSYVACAAGFIPPIHEVLSWTTPPLIGGYLATGTWHGVALQVFNLAIATGIYLPFVRASQRQINQSRQENFRELLRGIDALTQGGEASGVLTRGDAIGGLARQLASDIMSDIKLNRVRLVYQPQVNRAGRVVGVEALLRWDHALFGAIPPNITVAIAEEAALICALGDWVIDTACRQLRDWRLLEVNDVRMSINLSPTQLHEPGFVDRVRATLKRHHIKASEIELEITEGRAIGHDDATVMAMADLAAMGAQLAMDDFGMGYSSLLYMRRFTIHAIKLDGSLTREVLTNRSCQEIIETIAHLCHNKAVRIIAEFVETEEQRDLLNTLGCSEYQGYLYSKPLAAEDCLAFINTCNASPARASTMPPMQLQIPLAGIA